MPAARKHAAASGASRPVGVRISTGSATPASGDGPGDASRLPTGPVSFVRGDAGEHPTKLREGLADGNAGRPQGHLTDRILVRAAASLHYGHGTADRPAVFKIAKEDDRVG